MKVVILAGGMGTRLSEETVIRPKPMVEIGGMPILWHIMKIYSHYGFNDFVICLGYKGTMIKEFFADYFLHRSDVTFDLARNVVEYHDTHAEPWRVTLVDTGLSTMTGGRLKRVRPHLGNEPFMLTYGDGVAALDIARLVKFHRAHGRLATVTAVQPVARFGALDIAESGSVRSFVEKPHSEGGRISAGFFVLEPGIFDYLDGGDDLIWERGPLERLAAEGQLEAFRYDGYWRPMDTLRDRQDLERMWNEGEADWKVWND